MTAMIKFWPLVPGKLDWRGEADAMRSLKRSQALMTAAWPEDARCALGLVGASAYEIARRVIEKQ